MALLAPALCLLSWVGAPEVRSEDVKSFVREAERIVRGSYESGLGERVRAARPRVETAPHEVFGSIGERCHVSSAGSFEDRALGVLQSDSRPPDRDELALVRGPDYVEHRVQVRKGDTFAGLMDLYEIPMAEALAWHASARKIFDLSKLKVGHTLSLFFRRGTWKLVALEYEVNRIDRIVVDRGLDGTLRARKAIVPTWVEYRGVSGTVGTSITQDCHGAAVPSAIVNSLAKLFDGELSFRKLQRGDRFRVLYEVHVDRAGAIVRTGRILAAEIVTKGKPHVALYFAENGADGDYFDQNGNPRRRNGNGNDGFFFPPVRGARLSSGFSRSRRHPVHGRVRPHYGVDFAAPQGTPVRAIADGRVSFAHWHGALGRAIRVEHGGSPTYASIYGHLSRIEEGIRKGAWVRKGDVIGYVGRTGAATGPHLHLAIRRNGRYVDPLPVLRFARPVVASRATGQNFEREKRGLLRELASLDADGPVRLTRLAMRK